MSIFPSLSVASLASLELLAQSNFLRATRLSSILTVLRSPRGQGAGVPDFWVSCVQQGSGNSLRIQGQYGSTSSFMSIHGPGDQTTSDKDIPFHHPSIHPDNKNLVISCSVWHTGPWRHKEEWTDLKDLTQSYSN